jgi:hypothetical protein
MHLEINVDQRARPYFSPITTKNRLQNASSIGKYDTSSLA